MHSTNLGSYWTGQTGTEDWPVPLVAYDESICASSRGDFAQSSNCGSMSTDGTFSGHCLLQHSEAEREPNREASLSNGRRGDLGQVHQAAFARKDSQIGTILDLMAQLEEALGGIRDILVKRKAMP